MKRKPDEVMRVSSCHHCGREFSSPTRFDQKFCSVSCKNEASKIRVQRACIICGNGYTVRPSSKVRVCSQTCKRKLISISNTDDSTHVTSVCPTCNKTFTYLASWPRKYCCRACSAAATITNIKDFKPSSFTTVCEQCGEQFTTTPKRSRGRFCSQKCWGAWLSANSPRTNLGKKFGRPRYLPPPITKICPVCQSPFTVKPSHAARRIFCSKDCRAKWMSQNNTGENSPTWLGGYEPYYGESWHQARRSAQERDKCCADCGATPEALGRELDVHHITPLRKFGKDRHLEANDLSNLVCLCNVCHLKRDWKDNRRKK